MKPEAVLRHASLQSTKKVAMAVFAIVAAFANALKGRPVRLAGVKGLLRVGGGFVQRGGGGCLMGEGGFLGWARSPSTPPFKRTKGGRGFVKGGRGVCC